MSNENTSEDWGNDWVRSSEDKNFVKELCIEIINDPEKTLEFVLRHCKKDSEILEAGCGVGPWVHILDNLGYNITGLDYSRKALDIARKFNDNLKLIEGDVNSFQFSDNVFDVILSWGVLEHFSEGPIKSLTEKNRVLKAGGHLILGMPPRNLLRLLLQPLFKFKEWLKFNKIIRSFLNLEERERKLSLYYYSVRELVDFLENTGFKVTSITHTDHNQGLSEVEELITYKSNQQPFIFYEQTVDGKSFDLNSKGQLLTNFLKKLNTGILNYNLIISAKKIKHVEYNQIPKFKKSFFQRNSRY